MNKETAEKIALIAEMRKRMTFSVGRQLLNEAGFPKGRTWDDISEKLDDPGVTKAAHGLKLRDLFVESLAVCDKTATFYEVDEAGLKAAHKAASAIAANIPTHPFVDAFPFALSESSLRALPQNTATPVHVVELEGATIVIYCTSRLVELRETISETHLDAGLAGTYETVFGIKKAYIQSFNSVVLPFFGNTIEVHTDDGTQMNIVSGLVDQIALRNEFNTAVGFNILKSPRNLFPAIKSLYKSEEGDVALLSHTVANGIKHERMRGSKCVRKENFHKGGAEAVDGNLTPYQIAIRWNLNDDDDMTGRPELRLLGDYKMTYSATPLLTDAHIWRCAGYAQSRFVVQTLLAHTPV